jgi:2-C-methyl-D-erythritol 4-phosphate cytidylyltransferase
MGSIANDDFLMSTFALILPAAGKSTRFGGPRNKVLEFLGDSRVISHAMAPFLAHPELAKIIIACADPADLSNMLPANDRVQYCLGGPSRAHSVLEALRRVPTDVEFVAVHDAARPLISPGLVDQTLQAAKQHGAAVPALAVTLTIKQADGPLPAPVQRTIPRQSLWAMQTPQIMRRTDLLEAFEICPIPLDQLTDDVQLLELIGKQVWLIPGEEKNLKVTTAIDMVLANHWMTK